MKIDKNFLGGIFRPPNLNSIREALRSKLGCIPREDPKPVEYLPQYYPNPIIDPLIPPRVYPILRFRYCCI